MIKMKYILEIKDLSKRFFLLEQQQEIKSWWGLIV